MDDIVINTEIDRLIDILSQKKRVELDELAKQLGTDKKKIKKWLLVLEDEGYLKLEYRLTRVFAVWLLDMGTKAVDLPHIVEEDVKQGAEQAIAEVEIPVPKEEKRGNRKSYEQPKDNRMPKRPPSEEEEAQAKRIKTSASLADAKARMDECAEEAKTLGNNIKELEARKEKLDIELPQMEKYGEEKIDAIADRMDALQKRMDGLRKNLKGAEDIASRVGQRGRMAKELVDEASSVYMKLDSIFAGLREAGKDKTSDLAKSIAELESETAQEEKRLSVLEQTYSLIDRSKKETEKKADAIRETIAAAKKQLDGALAAIGAIESERDAFATRVSKARKAIADRKEEVEALKREIENTGKLEAKLDKYLETYMKETDDIRTLVTSAEADIRDIDEKASASAMELYREELEKASGKIEQKLKETEEGKAKLDSEIAEKRARLRNIRSEAKELEGRLKGNPKKKK